MLVEGGKVTHKIYYDEQNKVVVLDLSGEFTLEDAREIMKVVRDSRAGKMPYRVLVDLEKISINLDRDTRKFLQEETGKLGISRMAMVVSNPIVRMTGKVMTATMGKNGETGFFKTREEAVVRLKGEA